MPMYKPTELRLFLNQLGIFPRKGLSQNFLIDGNIIRKIIQVAQVEKDDIVLEIGPGPGSLTQALLEAGAIVIAVEKDEILAHALERLQTPSGQLHVFCEDIMQFPIQEIVSKHLKEHQKAKVIANLPYHLTTPILAALIPLRNLFSSLTVMVQEEVAQRFVASPNTKEYGSFTVFLNFYSQPHYGFFVSPHCFYPEPKVGSAVVRLDLREPPEVSDINSFFKLTRTSFEHRRKMLRASLKSLYPPQNITQALASIGKNVEARPETLSLADFIRLHHALSSASQEENNSTQDTHH